MKIKYIIEFFKSVHDLNGNSYTAFKIIDTETGVSIDGTDVSSSTVEAVPFYLNGDAHVSNVYFTETTMKKREFFRMVKEQKWGWIANQAANIAEAFKRVLAKHNTGLDQTL